MTTAPAADQALRRLQRDTMLAGVALSAGALALWPGSPTRAFGVAGGLLLMALAYTGIKAAVDTLWAPPERPGAGAEEAGNGSRGRRPGFVKFFTRHVMLAACAYVMIARFELDPVAMLAGVTTPAIAVAIEVVRNVRSRTAGRHSRIS